MTEPDLDQPGKPLEGKAFDADGTWAPFQIPQTKRDNCAAAAYEAGGLDKVSDAYRAKWELTRSDYNEFRMDHAAALKRFETYRQSDEILLREFPPGPPDREKYIETLKRLMPDDWQQHLPPD
jgi:hypothetical protein